MGQRLQVFLLLMYLQTFNRATAALTDTNDFVVLSALKANWQQTPPNWVGSDPCGGGWEGILCTNSRISSIVLAGMAITGTLSGDIGNFPELQTLDLSQNQGLRGPLPSAIANLKNLQNLWLVGCSFSGPIPERIGSLTQLVSLSLASNNFTGAIPPSIGNLSNLFLLDLTDNKLGGTIPVSSGTSPGLDLLLNARHFHLGKNQLTGTVPPKLFSSKMKLIHLLLDSNQLSGNIPSTLEELLSLEAIRLDRNSFGGPVLLNFTSLTSLSELYLSNNQLTGAIPDLTGMNSLTYVDMSNNSFSASSIPLWFQSLPSLTSLIMERTQLQGAIPATLFRAVQLQSIVLSNNHLNGTLDIDSNYNKQLQLIDIRNNSLDKYAEGSGYNGKLLLQGNPICGKIRSSRDYCASLQKPNSPYSTARNCLPGSCKTDQIRSPNCNCAFPISGTLYFRAFSFSDFENASYYTSLDTAMMESFKNERLPVDSISLSVQIKNPNDYLQLKMDVFPSGTDRFNRTGFSIITSQLNNISFVNISYFGPYYYILDSDGYFAGLSKSSNSGLIIGATVGGFILMALLLVAGVYAFRQKKRAARAIQLSNPFASWDQSKSSGAPPQIKGVKSFSFEDIKKCTNNFSDANILGTGGYGKVYMGILNSGAKVAIKRAQQGSLQGSAEFKNEIELLTRLHHRNLVSLLGFCYELGEQMLVYEYISNGTLKDNISGKTGIQLSWTKRLTLALDSARGIAYLHEFADPPIIHRDIKSNNILLDDHLIAKVADFGLSKPFGTDEGHVTTGVKGTMGYMDPEYFMTEQLTEKSDVYSFGVVMLELLTGRKPIEHGIHIVRKVRMAMDKTKDLYNLHETIDPAIRSSIKPKGLEKFVGLAIRCVEETRAGRPTMGEVVKELENILQLPGEEYDSEMLFTSVSNSGTTTEGSLYSSYNLGYFQYSGSFPQSERTRQ